MFLVNNQNLAVSHDDTQKIWRKIITQNSNIPGAHIMPIDFIKKRFKIFDHQFDCPRRVFSVQQKVGIRRKTLVFFGYLAEPAQKFDHHLQAVELADLERNPLHITGIIAYIGAHIMPPWLGFIVPGTVNGLRPHQIVLFMILGSQRNPPKLA